jgi:hypothetical protein
VFGAALGGHTTYADTLINQGASRDVAVRGAAVGGHTTYADTLIKRGASLDQAVDGLIYRKLSANEPDCLIKLPNFHPKILTIILSKLNLPPAFKATQQRIVKMSKLMHQQGLTYKTALLKTTPDFSGALYILMLYQMDYEKLGVLSKFPFEVLVMILEFAGSRSLATKEMEQLGLMTLKQHFSVKLAPLKRHSVIGFFTGCNATNMISAIEKSSNRDELKITIDAEKRTFKAGEKEIPYKAAVISLSKMLEGSEEEPAPAQVLTEVTQKRCP